MQAGGRLFAGSHADEARKQSDQQVGIGRIAMDEAPHDTGLRGKARVADTHFTVHPVSRLEGIIRQFGFHARRTEEGVAEGPCRKDVVARAQFERTALLRLEPAAAFGEEVEGRTRLLGHAHAPAAGAGHAAEKHGCGA